MKLIFRKDAEQNISVVHQEGDEERTFSYVDMIKHLIEKGDMTEPELDGDFTDAETSSVKSMVTHINDELTTLKEHWAEEE